MINIADRLHSTATEKTVAGANEIYDDAKGKKQDVINQENDEHFSDLEDESVRVVPQEFTQTEQAQARQNLNTYSKNEVNQIASAFTEQNYVSVQAVAATTAADIATLINATGEGERTDTIYRVGWFDGTAFDVTKYSEYTWNGTAYLQMAVRSTIGEVFDISVYNQSGGTPVQYETLALALGTNGANVPSGVRQGGMSVKFIQSSDNKYVQYRLMANDFTTDTTQWTIADEGVYVENPEFVCVYTDAEDRILWGIKADADIFYGAGVPTQLREYVEKKIEELSLDEYEDIVAFLDGFIGSDTTLQAILESLNITIEKKVDKEEGKSLIDEEYASGIRYIENPEFVEVKFDSEERILEAIMKDGTKLLPAGIKTPSIDLDGAVVTHIDSPEFIAVWLTSDDRILFGLQKDGNFFFGCGVPKQIEDYISKKIAELSLDEYEDIVTFLGDLITGDKTLAELLNEKVDKEEGRSLIDEDVAEGIHYVENPEFINVKLDADKRIIEATKNDGMKYFAVGVNIADVSVEYSIDSPEYVGVFLDGKNHILMAFENDGNVYYGIGVPKQIKKYVDDNINTIQNFLAGFDEGTTLLEYLNDTYGRYVENPEYINVETDAEKKILAGRKTDGTKFESVGFETPSISLDGVGISTVNDPEERMELNLDREKKIISYRDKDGILHENIGIKTNNFSLTEQGMTDFKQALKDAGFPGGGGNYSDKDLVELPEPEKYALLNLIVEQLPVAGSVDGIVEYYDGMGNYFKKECSVEIQGQTSKIFAQTGGKGNYTLDFPVDIKFGSWVPQDSFHLKGCAKDVTRAILPTSYKWAYMMQEFLHSKPNRVLVDESGITATSATGKRMNDWPNDARCLPDGFPCEVYLNGEYWGLYSFQLKKHRKNYSMNKKDYTSFFLDADDFGADFWNGTINWEAFEIKGPKDLVCMDGTAYDGDAPKELIDSTSQYYNPSNSKHVGSALTKSIIESFSVKYLEVKGYIDNSDLVTAKEKFEEYFDVEACIFVYIYNCLMKNNDSVRKNTLWGDYKNGKIVPMLWDLDGMYGTGWIGNDIVEPSAYMWTGLYATSAWPLALLWTLYQADIKTAYANLRQNKVINIDTWHSIMFGWVNRVGEEAYNRDIKKWPETPSYRKNLTNTDYWVEVETTNKPRSTPLWDNQTQYAVNGEVVLKTYPTSNWYIKYKAVQANIGVCPVTGFYDGFPVIGGCWDSPKRMEKWIEAQISLCDSVLEYNV